MSDKSDAILNDKWFRVVGNPLSVVLFKLAQLSFFESDWRTFIWKFLISLAFTIWAWEVARQIIIRARKNYSGLRETKYRIGFTALWLAVEMLVLHLALTQLLFSSHLAATYAYSFVQFWLLNAAIGFLVFFIICGIYEAMYFFHQYKLALKKAEQLKKQQAQQQLDALKTRINPHFLFNSLTTLSALISEDAPKAERFVDELSKVYRYMLRAGRQQEVSLDEEWQFAQSYAFLLKNRFEEGAFSLDQSFGGNEGASQMTNPLDRLIPSLTLQHCLDYFVRTQHLPLHIEVSASEKHLRLTGPNHPKALSFDASDSDWRQLEAIGARTDAQAGRLEISIPFTPKNTAS